MKHEIEIEGLPEGWEIINKKTRYPYKYNSNVEEATFNVMVHCKKNPAVQDGV